MDSINEVMEAVKAYCKEKTSDATYAFYIKDIKAVSFENSKTVTLELRSDFVMGIVSDRYTALLQDAFKAILGFDVEIRYVVAPPEDGVKPGDSENQMDENPCPAAGMNSPLRTSSRARPTSLRLRPRRLLRQTPPARTTRCSSTGRPVWARPTF